MADTGTPLIPYGKPSGPHTISNSADLYKQFGEVAGGVGTALYNVFATANTVTNALGLGDIQDMFGGGMYGGSTKGGRNATSSTTDLPIPVEHQTNRGSVLATRLPADPQPGNISGSAKGGGTLAAPAASSSPTLGTSSTTSAATPPANTTTPTPNTPAAHSYRPFSGGLLGGFANLGGNNQWNTASGSSWGSGNSGAGTGLGSLLTGIGRK